MITRFLSVAALLAVATLFTLPGARAAEADNSGWADDFATLPGAVAQHTWWHWMDGNVSREGITADLESMKRVGIRSATIVNIGYKIPDGPVKFLGPEWLDRLKFATQEANRLGMQIGMGNCDGWSSTGGPWVTPEYSMQMIVDSHKQFTGPKHVSEVLPQPEKRKDYYEDIGAMAFPTPAVETVTMESNPPKITGSDPSFDGTKINHGSSTLPLPTPGHPQYIQLEFTQPFEARHCVFMGFGEIQAEGEIQASDDGQTFHTLRHIISRFHVSEQTYALKDTSAKFYRFVFLSATSPQNLLTINRLRLSPAPRVDNFRGKADYDSRMEDNEFGPTIADNLPDDAVVHPDKIIDLTSHLDKTGKLDWDVPPGNWTVLRFGHTTTGVTNHPATADGTGLECDKLSRKAAKFYWDGFFPRVKAAVGPLMGKSFTHMLIDSYEVGNQNWTPAFREEFKKRRGYDLFPYLPTLSGMVVGSAEQSDRFLWDFRRTIADMFAENYFDYFAELSHEAGIKFESEPYGDGPFDVLRSGKESDRIMGEFWWPGGNSTSVRFASSIAHIYGKTVVGAESFTSSDGGWDMSPPTMKALGDEAFCNGLNSCTFHRFTHQPFPNRYPGMTMALWGSNLERTNTWWEQGSAWMKYLSRCDYLLQKGLPVADVLCFDGEGSPSGPPQPPLTGYDYDACNSDVIMNGMTVKDGRVTLPSGTNYRLLVLTGTKKLTPPLLRKLKELADAGAVILGPKPEASPSLSDYPQCDDEVTKLAGELWDGGKIVPNDQPLAKRLTALGLKPDFEPPAEAPLLYTHRVAHGTDIYFVSNQRASNAVGEATFRVSGKAPELWHPDTGKIEKVAIYTQDGDVTRVPLRLDPAGSVFVVFRPAKDVDHPTAVTLADSSALAPIIGGLQITSATYAAIEGPGSLDVTDKLQSMVKDGHLSVVVGNDLFGQDPAQNLVKQLKVQYVLAGKPDSKTLSEGQLLDLSVPDLAPPNYQLHTGDEGALKLEASKAGSYAIQMSGGKVVNAQVDRVAAPVTLDGPWEIDFPPNWGAPPKTTLDQLASWSDNADSGVKYFSGTATYKKTVPIPTELVGKGCRLYLDLGAVQVIAEVKLNGKDLGILWKPPYRVDVTSAAQAGDNALEVAVTNLWPNRLIGDEQLPPDCEWNADGSLKAWPQWMLDGKPSPTGHLTFASWHHLKKDDALLPSGILGPVLLRPAVEVAVP